MRGEADKKLYFVYPDRRFHPLADIEGWVVPAPDKKHVAFLKTSVTTNT